MRTAVYLVTSVIVSVLLAGCVNSHPPMGSSVALLRAEQTYNPNATADNMNIIPTGSGERMQATLDIYHKETASDENESISAQKVLTIPISD